MGTLMLAVALLAGCRGGADADASAAETAGTAAPATAVDTAVAPVQAASAALAMTPAAGTPNTSATATAGAPAPSAVEATTRGTPGEAVSSGAGQDTDMDTTRSAPPDAGTDTAATPAAGAQDPAVAALRAASRAYASVSALRADFVQTLRNPLLGTERTSRGTLYQRQPDRFLLRFTEPAGDIILADGQYFWVYYPSVDQQQVIRSPASEPGRSGIDLRSQFIGDPLERFRVQDLGPATVRGRSTRVLLLRPREAAGYRSLKVWIDDGDHLVRTFEIDGEQGVVRHFELTNVALNPSLPDSLFQFTPPPDARIVDRG